MNNRGSVAEKNLTVFTLVGFQGELERGAEVESIKIYPGFDFGINWYLELALLFHKFPRI